jgi:hypothetical protein
MAKIHMHGAAHWHRVGAKRVGMVLAEDGRYSGWQHAIVKWRMNLCLVSVDVFYLLLSSLWSTAPVRLGQFQPINSLFLPSLMGVSRKEGLFLPLYADTLRNISLRIHKHKPMMRRRRCGAPGPFIYQERCFQ